MVAGTMARRSYLIKSDSPALFDLESYSDQKNNLINSNRPILVVIPAEAGIQERNLYSGFQLPAFAGTSLHLRKQVREWQTIIKVRIFGD